MAVIVDIDHETGDLSQYTATVTDSGDLSVAAGAALAGTGNGLSCLIDDATAIYGDYDLGTNNTSGKVRARFYVDPNSITMANGENFAILLLRSATASKAAVWLRYQTGIGYQIFVQGFGDTANPSSSNYAISDAPHYIEVYLQRATTAEAGDGSLALYIDGILKQTLTFDNYDNFTAFRVARMGAATGIDAGTSGTFYLDELVVNDDGGLIGPVAELNHYVLTADVGSLALSGVDANFLRTYVLATDVGNFALSSVNVGLLRGYTLTADVGSYSLTGIDISFFRTYILWAAIGNYLLTGVDAVLSYMGVSNAIGRVSAHTISPYSIIASNIAVSDLSESESANSVESSEV